MITIRVLIDFDRDGTFDHVLSDISHRVRDSLFWSAGWQNVDQVESNVSSHVSPVNQLRLTVHNGDGLFSFENTEADFYNLLHTGLMVKVVVSSQDVSYSFTYWVQSIQETLGKYGEQVVNISCVDAMPRVQTARIELDVNTNVLTSNAINMALDQATVTLPYTNSYFFIDYSEIDSSALIFEDSSAFRSTETGYTTLDYVGDVIQQDRKGNYEQKLQNFIADICIAEGFGRWFYQPRDVKFYWHNRYHDKLQATKYTLSGADYVTGTPANTRVYNDVELHYFPRNVSQSNAVIFNSDAVPITINPESSKTIRVKYSDPDAPEEKAAAIEIVDPTTSDIVITDTDANNVTLTVYQGNDLKGAGGSLFFENTSTGAVTIDTLTIRGKIVTMYDAQIASAKDGTSIGTYNWTQMPSIRGSYISDPDFAQGLADFLLLRHKTMRRVLQDITLEIDVDNFDYLDVTIGDVIQVSEDFTGHNKEYVVLGEQHNYDVSSGRYRLVWSLRSNDTTPYFIIDSSEIDGPDIIGL